MSATESTVAETTTSHAPTNGSPAQGTEQEPHDTTAPPLPAEQTHRPRHLAVVDERGITTAEYAVGTAAGAGLAGLLYTLLTGGFGDRLLKTLFDHVLGLLGIG